jgi:hypothetical protein
MRAVEKLEPTARAIAHGRAVHPEAGAVERFLITAGAQFEAFPYAHDIEAAHQEVARSLELAGLAIAEAPQLRLDAVGEVIARLRLDWLALPPRPTAERRQSKIARSYTLALLSVVRAQLGFELVPESTLWRYEFEPKAVP